MHAEASTCMFPPRNVLVVLTVVGQASEAELLLRARTATTKGRYPVDFIIGPQVRAVYSSAVRDCSVIIAGCFYSDDVDAQR